MSSIVTAAWVAIAVFSVSLDTSLGQDRTIKEFKQYVSERTNGQLSEAKLERIAELVDKNGDGKISPEEFGNRMEPFRQVMSGEDKGAAELEKKRSKNEGQKKKQDVVEIEPLVDTPDAPVLLITADELAESWIPFAKWKTANGKLTRIVTVGQIDRDVKADSLQEKIRLFVRDHIDNHKTRWVVLGGDCLPGGKGLVPGGHTTIHAAEPSGIPTDIVYISETNWDADGDGVYGEFKDDRDAIRYPDGSIGLGRVPVRTAQDVAAFTEKVISYESDYPVGSFATSMIYTCTDKPAYPKVRNSWDGYLSKSWESGDVGRFFSAETPWDEENDPGSHDLTAENVVTLFNSKSTGKIHIHGHGHLPAWVLEDSMFTQSHAAQLDNSNAYPLITTVSCNTGEYDSKKDPSIVERLLRLPKAGSVAIVAPIRTGKPHFSKRSDFRLMVTEGKLDGTTLTMTRYWQNGLGEKAASTGHAIMQAKQAMAEDAAKSANFHLCVCELNLLGDPTLDMRAQNVRRPEVTYSIETGAGSSALNVSTDAPGSTVCVWGGGNYSTAVAGKNGVAAFTISHRGALELDIAVSGSSLNSVTQKAKISAKRN